MQYLTLLSLALAFIGVDAKIAFTNTPGSSVTVGVPFTIEWDGADSGSAVTITLKKGNPNNLQTVSLLTGNGQDGQYVWTPSKLLQVADDYALEISQGTGYDESNYSGEFEISGGAAAASSGAAASSSSSGSASSSSSSNGNNGGGVVVITSGSSTYTTTEATGMGTASGTGSSSNSTMSNNMTMTSMMPTTNGGIQVSSTAMSSAPAPSSSSSSKAMAAQAHVVGGIGGLAAAALGFVALL